MTKPFVLAIGAHEKSTRPIEIYADLPADGSQSPYMVDWLSPLLPQRTDLTSPNGYSWGRPAPRFDWRTSPLTSDRFPDLETSWKPVARYEHVSLAPSPISFFPDRYLEFHVPVGSDISIAGTDTPVFIWGRTGTILGKACTSITAFVDLQQPDGRRDVPAIRLHDVGSASVMLWNANGAVEFVGVEELNLGAHFHTGTKNVFDKTGPPISVSGTSYLRTMTVGRKVRTEGRVVAARVNMYGGDSGTTFDECWLLYTLGPPTGSTTIDHGDMKKLMAEGSQHIDLGDVDAEDLYLSVHQFTMNQGQFRGYAYVNEGASAHTWSSLHGAKGARLWRIGGDESNSMMPRHSYTGSAREIPSPPEVLDDLRNDFLTGFDAAEEALWQESPTRRAAANDAAVELQNREGPELGPTMFE